jgi:hypothetical protein
MYQSLDDLIQGKQVNKPTKPDYTKHSILLSRAWCGLEVSIIHREGKFYMDATAEGEQDTIKIDEAAYKALLPYRIDRLSDEAYCKKYCKMDCGYCGRQSMCKLPNKR